MNPNYLDFEQPIAELEAKIEELRYVGDDSEINIGEEITKLQEKSAFLPIFRNCTVIAALPMTLPLLAVWRALMVCP